MHGVRRCLQSGVDESNNLTAKLRHQRDGCRMRRMLPSLAVACRYGVRCGDRIALRIEAGVMLGAFEERAGDSVSIGCSRRTDRNRGGSFVHDKSITRDAPDTPRWRRDQGNGDSVLEFPCRGEVREPAWARELMTTYWKPR